MTTTPVMGPVIAKMFRNIGIFAPSNSRIGAVEIEATNPKNIAITN